MRNLTGYQGKFSDELEAFWKIVLAQYVACFTPHIPEAHVPFWYARIVDQGIPIAYREPVKPKADLPPPIKRAALVGA